MSPPPDGGDTARLTELFHQHSRRVYAYARRHVEETHCDDIVSETFLVAWRKPERVPDEPLPWLIGVARNVIANHRRSTHRADRLWLSALREGWTATAVSADAAVVERETMIAALAECSEAEREALLLTAWDGLTPEQAALVAGCSSRAFTVRLHRARTRLRTSLARRERDEHPQPSATSRPAGGRARTLTTVQETS
jgi:RNA polymerase sigma-70 factor (ECF subfamily)